MKLCATFVAQMQHKMWHNLGCMGGNQYKYRKYVPQSVAQKTMCHKCHKCGTKCGTIGGIGDKINTRNLTTKKQGAADQKLKINTEKVKTRQLQSFLDENPKIEIFQVKT